jgi:hypothetical protein
MVSGVLTPSAAESGLAYVMFPELGLERLAMPAAPEPQLGGPDNVMRLRTPHAPEPSLRKISTITSF